MKYYSTNYSLYLYTEIVFGKGTESQTGALARKHGGSKAMVVVSTTIKKNRLYGCILDSLAKAGIAYIEFSGVKPNPLRSHCQAGVELAKKEGIDFLVAIGGGSVIDTAKAIGFAMKYEGDWFEDLFIKHIDVTECVPVGVIPTMASSGAETSTSCMLVDDIQRHDKFGGGGPLSRPVFAILNPELTYSVPKFQTAAGAVDIFAHTLERYFYVENDCALGDEFAEGLMRNVLNYGPIACNEPDNFEARAELLLCSSFSHNDITGIGHSGKRGGPHYLEGCLSGTFNATHGASIAVVMPAWLKYVADFSEEKCARVAKLAITVFGVIPDLFDLKQVAYEGIENLKKWLKNLDMPSTLNDLGVTEKDLPTLLGHPSFGADGLHRAYVTFTREQMEAFYRSFI